MTYIMQRSKDSHLILPVRPRVRGFFKLTAIRPDGRRRPLTDWFPNLITDGGLNRMGTNNYLSHCHVGSGSATPANSDSALQTFVASTNTIEANSGSVQSSEPYYAARTVTYRFAAGAAEGNLSEVGVGWGGTSTGPLFSRALIVDGGGSPTSITVLSDEVLDVAYELRLIPPAADDSYNVVDSGPAGTTHAVVLRPSLVATLSDPGSGALGWGIGGVADMSVGVRLQTGTSQVRVTNGVLGAVTESPTGTTGNRTSVTNEDYVNSSLERESSAFWDLGDGNVSGGVSTVQFQYRSAGCWQASFDPAIPKDSEKVLTLGFKVEWSRAT